MLCRLYSWTHSNFTIRNHSLCSSCWRTDYQWCELQLFMFCSQPWLLFFASLVSGLLLFLHHQNTVSCSNLVSRTFVQYGVQKNVQHCSNYGLRRPIHEIKCIPVSICLSIRGINLTAARHGPTSIVSIKHHTVIHSPPPNNHCPAGYWSLWYLKWKKTSAVDIHHSCFAIIVLSILISVHPAHLL